MAEGLKIKIFSDTTDFSTGLKNIGNVAKTSLVAVTTGITAVSGALVAVTETTREYREEMNKLDTAFEATGKTTQQAEQIYKDFYGILGETDQAVEAVSHLAELTNSQEELSKWTNISAGVLTKFGDSLMLEGLTESANETAKLGVITGSLADALNWAGHNEDEFNASLAQMSTEAERSTFITETLNDIYGDLGETYRETNEDVINARLAQEEFNGTMARIGEIVEPALNDLKFAFSDTMNSIIDGFEENGVEGIVDVLEEMLDGAIDTIQDSLPALKEQGVELLDKIIEGLNETVPALRIMLVNMLANMVTWIFDNLPAFLDTGIEIINTLITGFVESLPTLLEAVVNLILALLSGFWDNMPAIFNAGVQLIVALVNGLISSLPSIVGAIFQLATGIVEEFKKTNWLQLGIDILQGIIDGMLSMVGNALASVWNIGEQIIEGFKSVFDINSPSKVMYDLQQWNNKGLLNAMSDGTPMLVKGAINQASALKTALKGNMGRYVDTARNELNRLFSMAGTNSNNSSIVNNTRTTNVEQNFYTPTTSPLQAYRRLVRDV